MGDCVLHNRLHCVNGYMKEQEEFGDENTQKDENNLHIGPVYGRGVDFAGIDAVRHECRTV